jgi:hypothetical protein
MFTSKPPKNNQSRLHDEERQVFVQTSKVYIEARSRLRGVPSGQRHRRIALVRPTSLEWVIIPNDEQQHEA